MSTHSMFSLRNKKNVMWIPPLICSYGPQTDIIYLMPAQRLEGVLEGGIVL